MDEKKARELYSSFCLYFGKTEIAGECNLFVREIMPFGMAEATEIFKMLKAKYDGAKFPPSISGLNGVIAEWRTRNFYSNKQAEADDLPDEVQREINRRGAAFVFWNMVQAGEKAQTEGRQALMDLNHCRKRFAELYRKGDFKHWAGTVEYTWPMRFKLSEAAGKEQEQHNEQ